MEQMANASCPFLDSSEPVVIPHHPLRPLALAVIARAVRDFGNKEFRHSATSFMFGTRKSQDVREYWLRLADLPLDFFDEFKGLDHAEVADRIKRADLAIRLGESQWN